MSNLKFKTANAPSIIFRIKDLKITDRVVLFNLADLLKKNVEPTQKLLEYVAGISERTLNRSLKELEKLGFISRKTTLFNGKGKKTEYNIIWNKISKYAVANDYKNGNIQENCQNIENNINNIDDMGNFSGYAINNQRLEQVEETNYTPVGNYYDDEDLSMLPSEEDNFPPIWNEEKQCYMGVDEVQEQNIEIPVEEPTDEQIYGSDVIDFIEENPEVLIALKATVDYYKYNDEDKELGAKDANKEINRLVKESGNTNEDFVKRLEQFCMNYSNEYDKYKYNEKYNTGYVIAA